MQEVRGISELEAEREVLGFDHAEIGEWIATRWNIPPRLREAILYHHRPHDLLERSPGSFSLVKLVAIANTIAHASAEGLAVEAIHERLEEGSLLEPGLEPQSLEEILAAVDREKNEIKEILAPSEGRTGAEAP